MLWFTRKDTKFINFSGGCGWSLCIDDRRKCIAHGRCSEYFQKGDLIYGIFEKGMWLARVKKIEWKSDPSDMFFLTYETINSEKELTKLELELFRKEV